MQSECTLAAHSISFYFHFQFNLLYTFCAAQQQVTVVTVQLAFTHLCVSVYTIFKVIIQLGMCMNLSRVKY